MSGFRRRPDDGRCYACHGAGRITTTTRLGPHTELCDLCGGDGLTMRARDAVRLERHQRSIPNYGARSSKPQGE